LTSLLWKPNDPLIRIPARSLVKEGERLSAQIPSPREMLRDLDLKKHYQKYHDFPQRPGALIGTVAFHSFGNDLFDLAGSPLAVDPTGRWDRKLQSLLKDPRTS